MINLETATSLQIFCFALSKTPREWGVSPNGAITNPRGHSVCRVILSEAHPLAEVVDADYLWPAIHEAVFDFHGHGPALRRQLLAACGIEEREDEEDKNLPR